MAKYHGKNTHITVDGVDLSDYFDDVTIPNSIDVAETSTFGQDAKTYVEGLSDATIDAGGKWDDTAVTGPDVVLAGLMGGGEHTVIIGPSGSAAGKRRITVTAILTSYEVSMPLGDVVAFTASWQVSGPVTRDVFA